MGDKGHMSGYGQSESLGNPNGVSRTMIHSLEQGTAVDATVEIETPWGRKLVVVREEYTPGDLERSAQELLDVAAQMMTAAGKLRRLARQREDLLLENLLRAERA